MQEKNQSTPFHSRAFYFNSLKRILIIVIAGLFIKFCIIDIRRIDGHQMSPTTIKGDRFAVLRISSLPLVRSLIKPRRLEPVLFKMPFEPGKEGYLRIAGIWADTVSIDSGIFFNSRLKSDYFKDSRTSTEIIPSDYSPRDFFAPFRVPASGDTLYLETDNLRDLFFAISVIRQENPALSFSLNTKLLLDDSVANDYFINGFSIYEGLLDSIPVHNRFDWFFWTRLKEYLSMIHYNQNVNLKFTFCIDGEEVSRYVVKGSYVFLLADNWKNGLDSRFFGPLKTTSVIGKPFMILWSYNGDPENSDKFKINRIGRIIK